jgi:tetratricopeptide (TPR) repeat protein
VLGARTAKLGADHIDTLATKTNVAVTYEAQRKYAQAETLFKEVLEARTAKQGVDHPDTLKTTDNLALVYENQRKYSEAATLLKEVLDVQTNKRGANHPDTLTTKNSLARLYWLMKMLDRSIPLFEEVVEQRKKKLGANHTDTLIALANLGVNYRDAGRLDDGIRCLEGALAVMRELPGPVPAALVPIPGMLGETYDRAKQYAKSEALYRDFLTKGRQDQGEDDPRTAKLMAQLANNLLFQKKHAEAEPVLRDCLAVRKKKQPDEWATFNTMSMLGGALLGQKKYTDSEPLLVKGYEGMKKREKSIPPQGRNRLPEALDRLIELYTAINQPDEAKKWRAERAKFPAAKKPETKK